MSPVHMHPKLRAREEALEDAGLIQRIDSDGVTNLQHAENQGKVAKVIPVQLTFKFGNKSYTAK